jgi:hypothetical protein
MASEPPACTKSTPPGTWLVLPCPAPPPKASARSMDDDEMSPCPAPPSKASARSMDDDEMSRFHNACRKSKIDCQPWEFNQWLCMCIRCRKCSPQGGYACREKLKGWSHQEAANHVIAMAMGWPKDKNRRALCKLCWYEWNDIANESSRQLALNHEEAPLALEDAPSSSQQLASIVETLRIEVEKLKAEVASLKLSRTDSVQVFQ